MGADRAETAPTGNGAAAIIQSVCDARQRRSRTGGRKKDAPGGDGHAGRGGGTRRGKSTSPWNSERSGARVPISINGIMWKIWMKCPVAPKPEGKKDCRAKKCRKNNKTTLHQQKIHLWNERVKIFPEKDRLSMEKRRMTVCLQ